MPEIPRVTFERLRWIREDSRVALSCVRLALTVRAVSVVEKAADIASWLYVN